ncbi:putative ubiquitin carboxyl-terminal hydrolase ubh-4 [Venturia nashicola]|uniref:ubiquitinyl hydrolase 1 n=1 Tax=Venturia nashicola TaxID=86259 RepID=A0A4Z1NZA7_9PEZI|nr:putative ubiquitin carboxyl-terminal hydrolase ubh-4 [Venturia nashicola]
MAPKRKTNISRQNGQPTPTSSKRGTRSQTPASKVSQRNTSALLNIRDDLTSNGPSNLKTPASNENQVPSTPGQKAGKAVKRTRKSFPDGLTKANLAELSSDSLLSSPTGSLKEAVDHDYFNWARHGSTSVHGEIEDSATGPRGSPSGFKEVFDGPEDITAQSNPPAQKSRETTTSAPAADAASKDRTSAQIPEGAKSETADAELDHLAGHKGSADDIIHSVSNSYLATSDVEKSIGSLNQSQFALSPSKDVSASSSTESRRPGKRSISSVDELAIPDPPVKPEASRIIARTRRTTKNKSPSIASQDDLACKPGEVADSTANGENIDGEPLRRSKRAKVGGNAVVEFDPDDIELPYDEATESEIEEWQGWLEMISSPENFTVMMQEWGVRGIKTIDVWSLEPEDLVVLPQPVHGLVFCYPYRDGDASDQTDPCPDHVWFANQVDGTNACATVALMNILNNVPNAKLGPALQAFRSHTQAMNAVERGDYLNNFRPIKAVHNSFIHTTEMMEDDLAAEKDHMAWENTSALEAKKKIKAKLAAKKKRAAEKAARKRQRAAARAARKAASDERSLEAPPGLSISKLAGGVTRPGVATIKKARIKKDDAANTKKQVAAPKEPKKETPAMAKAAAKRKADALARARHHYVAYLPVKGELWKLDGMDDQPLNLGPCDHATWIDTVVPFIQASMIDLSQESIGFSLLAVVQDPLYNDKMDLAANIKTMQQVNDKLASVDPDWPMHEDIGDCLGDESLEGSSEDYNITEEMIDESDIASMNREDLQRSDTVGALLKVKKSLISQQKMLKSSIRSGKAEEDKIQAQVNLRRRDFGPLIQWQLMDLMDEGVLDELLDLHDPKKQKGAGGSAKKGNGKAKATGKGKK